MNEPASAIFAKNVLAALATVDSDGAPRSTALHVVTDGTSAYWFSPDKAVHSQNIVREGRASLCLFSSDESSGLSGVYVSGRASPIDMGDRPRIVSLYAARVGAFPDSFTDWTAYKLPIGMLDSEKSTGNCWYFYS